MMQVPYFVSVMMNNYSKSNDKNNFDLGLAYIDTFLHIAAWVSAVAMDAVLLTHEGSSFFMPAFVCMYAAVVLVTIAGGVVVVLSVYNIYEEIPVLAASFTSLITGCARASMVFTTLTLALLSVQLLLADAISGYTPVNLATDHVIRLLACIIAFKMFGVAATVNNHRLLSYENNLSGSST